jgi:hypothetical protein
MLSTELGVAQFIGGTKINSDLLGVISYHLEEIRS